MTSVPRSRYWLFATLAGGALLWDLVSKAWVFAALGYPFRTSDWSWGCPLLWGRFRIRLTTQFNQGALFGIGKGLGWLFALLSVVAAATIIYWLFVRGEAKSRWMTATLALILAGAMGNLYDRAYLHCCVDANGVPITGVRDFIDCTIPGIRFEGPFRPRLIREYEWPVFNFADTYLVTGAIMLALYSFFGPRPAEPQKAPPPGAPSPTAAPS